MISDCVTEYTHTCAHMSNGKTCNHVILVHVDAVNRPTPETCDDSVFKIG